VRACPPTTLAGAWHASPQAQARAAAAETLLVESGPFVAIGRASTATAGAVVVAVAGRFSDLRHLRARTDCIEAADPATILASAYRDLGPTALTLIRGEWTSAIWHTEHKELTLACDLLGGRSLHWAVSGAGIVFGENVRDVLELLPATPAPDRPAVSSWLAFGIAPDEGTLYAGLRRLSPGSALCVREGALETRSLWTPEYRGVATGDHAWLAERLRAEVDAAVARAVGDGRRPAVLLSGGLDSALVAASMATQTHRDSPVAYSARFPMQPEADESALIDTTTSHLGIASVQSVVTAGRPILGALSHLEAWRVPSTSPNTFLWLPILDTARADGRDVMLDGEGGDELFDSVPFYLFADIVASGRPSAAWRLTLRYPGVRPGVTRRRRARILAHFVVRGLLPASVHRRLDVWRPATLHAGLLRPSDARAAIGIFDEWAWLDGDGPRWWRYRRNALTRTRHLLDAPGSFRRTAALAPIVRRQPLMLDQDLVEFALTLPPEASFDARHNRPLARRAQADRLPDAVRLRARKSHFSGVLRASLRRDGELLADLLGSPDARVREFADVNSLERLLGGLHRGEGDDALASVGQLWRLAAIECWLRQLDTPSFALDLLGRLGPEVLDHRLVRMASSTST
jgi:asparagine synthase (glutamine-hydrolysing)